MKLLVITQKVDRDDAVLGFFHRWLEEFAKHCEKITVICLGQGEYQLPANVRVLSLGKEKSHSKLKYVFNFYKYLWQERQNYDTVFVHMNQEYVWLAGGWWRLTGKKILLWRNHPVGTLGTRLAVFFANRVFCTSHQSFTARYKKTEIMPAGIDTDFFKRDETIKKIPHSILFLGRISPIKKPDLLIEALSNLPKDLDYLVSFIGDPLPKDQKYYDDLKEGVKIFNLASRVKFLPAVPNRETVELYNQYELFVNLTPSGSLDKTIFEAMACGTITIVSNQSLTDLKQIDSFLVCGEGDEESLVLSLKYFLFLDEEKKKATEKQLVSYSYQHSLNKTISRVLQT